MSSMRVLKTVTETLRPEEQLLLCAARTHVDASTAERLRVLLDAPVDWEAARRLGLRHRVLPLLYKSLADHAPEMVPETVLGHLRTSYLSSAGLNLHLVHEVARVLQLFERRGVPALPFKGPVLAKTAYGTLGLRQCAVDMDVLIPTGRYGDAEALLTDDGYRLVRRVRALRRDQKAVSLRIKRQLSFTKAGEYNLDLHTGIMPLGYYFPLTVERLWERARAVRVGGVEIRDCAPEDLVLILCYQGVKNLWERLKYVCDVAEVVRAYPDMDWEAVLARARDMDGTRILLLGLVLAADLVGAPVPDALRAMADEEPRVRMLAEEVTRLMFEEGEPLPGLTERMRFHLALQTSWRAKLRYCSYAVARRAEEAYEEMRSG